MIIFDYACTIPVLLILLMSFFHVKISRIALYVSGALLLLWLVARTVITGHAPFSNTYETIIFFATLYVIKLLFSAQAIQSNPFIKLPALLLMIAASLLPMSMKEPRVLPPSLDSIWFYIHVPSFFIAYVSLSFALVMTFTELIHKEDETHSSAEIKTALFFMFTGLATGALWAHQSWAEFWGWDPKEIWALITWLLTALSLHFESRRARTICISAAFCAMLFTYFGVMFLLPGLHSYQ